MRPYTLNQPGKPKPDNAPDMSESAELQRKLIEATERLQELTEQVGLAKHVIEYDSDRRKRVLAIAANPLLAAGSSSAAADTEARASETYHKAMQQLGKEHEAACKTLAEWDATRIAVEVARSLLSMEKTKIGIL